VGEVDVTSQRRYKYERRVLDAGRPAGYCEDCRKHYYISRAAARKARKRSPQGLAAYPCPHGAGWHLGHLRDPEHSRDHHRARLGGS
jgi:hypothetical protein